MGEFLPEGTDYPSVEILGTQEELGSIFSLLEQAYRLDFSQYRHTTVMRRLSRRVSLAKADSLGRYLNILEENEGEREKLYYDFLLNFTQFFRDPGFFHFLKERVFPSLFEKKSVKSALRIWVPGCSSGEEVYSLAIAFHEFLEESRRQVPLQFFGTDLVEKHIVTARRGVFPRSIEENVSPERLARYFHPVEEGYKVTRFIREHCAFSVQDLIHDPPFAHMDLVSCRNVLIYLNEELQDRILPLFHFSLNRDSYLLLGTSESMGRYDDLFKRVENGSNLFVKIPSSSVPERYNSFLSPLRKEKVSSGPISSEKGKKRRNADLMAAMERTLQANYLPPALLMDGNMNIRQFRGDLTAYLKPASGEASLSLSRMMPGKWIPDIMIAMAEVRDPGRASKRSGFLFSDDDANRRVKYSLIPLEEEGEDMYCLVFEGWEEDDPSPATDGPAAGEYDERESLKSELALVKKHLRTIIEEKEDVNQELWSANEEIQSTNEELLSVNEELEAAKEELESSNEELLTLNEELSDKNRQLESLVAKHVDTLNILNDSQKNARIGTWWITHPGTKVKWSEEGAVLFGYEKTLREISVERLREKMTPESAEAFRILVERYVKGDFLPEPCFSLDIYGSNGGLRHLEVIYRIEEGKPGGDIRLTGTVQDITERLDAERELRQSESFLSSVVNSIQDGLCVMDRDLTIIKTNPVMERWYSKSSPLCGKKCYTGLRGFKTPCADCPARKTLLDGTIQTCLLPAERGRGIEWLEIFFYPMKDPVSGEITGIVEFIRDVTKKTNVENALSISENRLRRYMESAPVGIIVNDDKGRVREINDEACMIFGYTREEIQALGIQELITPDIYQDAMGINRDLMEKGRASGEIGFTDRNNMHRTLYYKGIQLNQGEYLSFITDMTERKEMESQLLQTEKMQVVGQLAGGIAHDFNNQLTGILGFADVMRSELPEDMEQVTYLDNIVMLVDRASGLTSQLLAYSRKGKYLTVPVNMHHIIAEVINILNHSLDKKITIRRELSAGDFVVKGDPTQLQNLILNLALNGRDAMMPGGGTLSFETENRYVKFPPPFFRSFGIGENHYLIVSVEDDGCGIPEKDRDRIFEPFFTTKEQGKGTGMGLAAAYGTVKNHEGALEVRSIEGKGSRFVFYLPLVKESVTMD